MYTRVWCHITAVEVSVEILCAQSLSWLQLSVTENPEKICESKTVINPHLFHRDGSSSCKSILISSNTFCALSSSSSAYKHIKLHQSMTYTVVNNLIHPQGFRYWNRLTWIQLNQIKWIASPTLFDLPFIWPKCAWNFISFYLYLTRREQNSYLCWSGKTILSFLMKKRESKYRLALFTAQNKVALVIVSPDSWRGWSELRYGRTGSPEPNPGRLSPARKPAIYKTSEKNRK